MINETYRLAIEALGPSGQQLVNVQHYRQTSIGGSDEGTELANAWIEFGGPAYGAMLSEHCGIVNIKVRNVDRPVYGTDVPVTPAISGEVSGDASSPTAPQIMTIRTGLVGKSYRGRNYLFPTGEALVGGGQIAGTYATLVASYFAAIQDLIDSVSGFEYRLGVWSPTLSVFTLAQSYTAQEFQGKMGSRRAGVGS